MCEAIIFDLGGVLVEFTGIETISQLSQGRLTPEDVRRFWLESTWSQKFETGRCSPEEFASGIIADLQLSMTTAEFLQELKSWEKGPFPGALDLLDELKSQFLLICLSNNNEVHWPLLCEKNDIASKFHHCYLSHKIGLMKPDPQIFEYVLSDLDLQAESVVFFDDSPECVESARNLGIQAYQVRGIQEVSNILRTEILSVKQLDNVKFPQ